MMVEQLDPRLTPARASVADMRLRDRVEAERYVVGEPRRIMKPLTQLRRSPRPDAGLETEVQLGDLVTFYAEEDGYAFVQLAHDGYVGYLPADGLGPADPRPTHRVTAVRTFLYPAPDLKCRPDGYLGLGARLIATGAAGAYLQIPGGYVFARHCAPIDAREADYARTAERLVGVPYLWGGRSSLGLDCSGLVQICLDMAGLQCPRDADMQESALGHPLPLAFADLRRGDFVFWRGHVG